MSEPWTIGRVATWTARDLASRGLESPRFEAELMVAHALGLRRIDIYLRMEQPLDDAELARIRGLVERRRRREPMAYILGTREFYRRSFTTDARALVPRPETEQVVDEVLDALRLSGDGVRRVLDIGTGTGAIAVTVALERPDTRVDAVDLSPAALSLASENVVRLGATDQVRLAEGRYFEPFAGERYDVVVSNPPYIPSAECPTLMPEVSTWEPRMALDGGADGLDPLREIARGALVALVPGGSLVVELGHDQGPAARRIAEEAGLRDVRVLRDPARFDRVLRATAP